jgi:hypothetical protein
MPRWNVALALIDVPASATQLDATNSTAAAHVIDKRVLLQFPLSARDYYLKPTAALFETIPRQFVNTSYSPATSQLDLFGIYLPAGLTIGHIVFDNVNAASTPTHWFFGLYDSALNQLATTADQTTTAWPANTRMSLAIATTAQGTQSTFVTTYTGFHYLGVCQTATTPAILAAFATVGTNAIGAETPVLSIIVGSTTTPPAFPKAVVNGGGISSTVYGYVAA